jgi:hypothetical protein
MPHLYAHGQTTTTQTLTSDARKLANKERRKAGREVKHSHPALSLSFISLTPSPFRSQRHEERKIQLKDHEFDRKWQRIDRDSQRQGKRPDDGTRVFVGRTPDNQRVACSYLFPSTTVAGGRDLEVEDEEESRGNDLVADLPLATSGAMLLAMARPAKIHRRRGRHRSSALGMTDGEQFEVVEIDGRLVALDEDGWEILPDENAEASLLYSDIVRDDVR